MIAPSLLVAALVAAAPPPMPSGAGDDAWTLARVVDRAAALSPEVLASQAQVDVAQAQRELAASSRWPSLTWGAQLAPGAQMTVPLLSRDDSGLCSAGTLACTVGAAPVATARSSTSLDARWRVFDFGVIDAGVQGAAASLDASRARASSSQARVVAAALQAYVAVLADDELLALREMLSTDRDRQAALVRARASLGEASPSQALQSDVAAEAAALDVVAARAQARSDRAVLAGVLALPPDPALAVLGALDVDVDATLDDIGTASASVQEHPDVRASNADVRAAGAAALRIARTAWPTVDASASTGVSVLALTKPDANVTPSIGAGLAMTWPLLDVARAAENAQADASLRAAQHTRDARSNAVQTEQARAHIALWTARVLVDRARALRDAAHAAVVVAEGRVQAGADPPSVLLDAQAALTQAALTLVQARAARAQAAVALVASSGRVDAASFRVGAPASSPDPSP